MHFYEYKNHIIYPSPRLSVESGFWTIQLSIRYGDKVRTFAYDAMFATKGEAVFHCINYGKKLIDEGGEFEAG